MEYIDRKYCRLGYGLLCVRRGFVDATTKKKKKHQVRQSSFGGAELLLLKLQAR